MTAPSHHYDVLSSETVFTGRIVSMRRDIVTMPGGGTSQRDVVEHPGAAAVVALDDSGRVMLVRQYRHPVAESLWELPAGLLDVADEPASRAAARELAEEAGLRADRWNLLADVYTTPGGSNEAVRIFLARDLAPYVPPDFTPENEELELERAWVDLDVAADRVLTGEIGNSLAIAGILATARARDRGFTGLRPAQVPWPARPRHSG